MPRPLDHCLADTICLPTKKQAALLGKKMQRMAQLCWVFISLQTMANNLQFWVSPQFCISAVPRARTIHAWIRSVLLGRACGRTALLCCRMGRPEHLTGWPAYTAPHVFTRHRHRLHFPHHKCVQCVVSRTNCRPYLDPNCFASALFYSHHLPPPPIIHCLSQPPCKKLIWNWNWWKSSKLITNRLSQVSACP